MMKKLKSATALLLTLFYLFSLGGCKSDPKTASGSSSGFASSHSGFVTDDSQPEDTYSQEEQHNGAETSSASPVSDASMSPAEASFSKPPKPSSKSVWHPTSTTGKRKRR